MKRVRSSAWATAAAAVLIASCAVLAACVNPVREEPATPSFDEANHSSLSTVQPGVLTLGSLLPERMAVDISTGPIPVSGEIVERKGLVMTPASQRARSGNINAAKVSDVLDEFARAVMQAGANSVVDSRVEISPAISGYPGATGTILMYGTAVVVE